MQRRLITVGIAISVFITVHTAGMEIAVEGRYAVNFLTSSVRTSNAPFRKDLGWSPRYPRYKEGLAQVVGVWRGER